MYVTSFPFRAHQDTPGIEAVFERILEIVFPVFAVTLIGWVCGRRQRPDLSAANRLNMEVFLPALVLSALAGDHSALASQWRPALAMVLMVLGSGLLAWPLARLTGLSGRMLVPPMMFNNCGNLGLPLSTLAFGQEILPTAVMLFLSSNLLHFSLGAWLLDHRQRVRTLWRIPVVIASVLGLGIRVADLTIWPPLLTAIHLLGEISVPLMLFSLGVKVAEAPFAHFRIGFLAGALRPLLGVGLMVPLTFALRLHGAQAGICLLYGALPPAVLNYMFADRYQQSPGEVASIVVVGNLLAIVIIPLILLVVLAAPRFH